MIKVKCFCKKGDYEYSMNCVYSDWTMAVANTVKLSYITSIEEVGGEKRKYPNFQPVERDLSEHITQENDDE